MSKIQTATNVVETFVSSKCFKEDLLDVKILFDFNIKNSRFSTVKAKFVGILEKAIDNYQYAKEFVNWYIEPCDCSDEYNSKELQSLLEHFDIDILDIKLNEQEAVKVFFEKYSKEFSKIDENELKELFSDISTHLELECDCSCEKDCVACSQLEYECCNNCNNHINQKVHEVLIKRLIEFEEEENLIGASTVEIEVENQIIGCNLYLEKRQNYYPIQLRRLKELVKTCLILKNKAKIIANSSNLNIELKEKKLSLKENDKKEKSGVYSFIRTVSDNLQNLLIVHTSKNLYDKQKNRSKKVSESVLELYKKDEFQLIFESILVSLVELEELRLENDKQFFEHSIYIPNNSVQEIALVIYDLKEQFKYLKKELNFALSNDDLSNLEKEQVRKFLNSICEFDIFLTDTSKYNFDSKVVQYLKKYYPSQCQIFLD